MNQCINEIQKHQQTALQQLDELEQQLAKLLDDDVNPEENDKDANKDDETEGKTEENENTGITALIVVWYFN